MLLNQRHAAPSARRAAPAPSAPASIARKVQCLSALPEQGPTTAPEASTSAPSHAHASGKYNLIDRRQVLVGASAVTASSSGLSLANIFNCPICLSGVAANSGGMAAAAAGATAGAVAQAATPGAARAEAWGYGDLSGPPQWGGVCAAGAKQSPINLTIDTLNYKPNFRTLGPKIPSSLEFDFKYGNFEKTVVLNTGHGTMQVNFGPGNRSSFNEVELELLQFHFHTPSEHAIDGRRSAMEVHLVHRNRVQGTLAVLGIMMEPGGNVRNGALQVALDSAPPQPAAIRPAVSPINPSLLLPKPNSSGQRPFYHYQGSLTTPPCSEEVDWFVFMDPIKIPDAQVLEFIKFVGEGRTFGMTNSRPLQPRNEREVWWKL